MFSTRGLFSQIPCPYQDDCKVPQCLFLHAPAQEQSSTATKVDNALASVVNATSVANGEQDVSEDDRRRKRQKLDDDKEKGLAIPSASVGVSGASGSTSIIPARNKADGKGASISSASVTGSSSLVRAGAEIRGKEAASVSAKPLATSSRPRSSLLPQPPIKKDGASKSAGKPNVTTQKPKDFYTPVAKATKAPEVLKVELLFPRMVNPAPAKHDIRHRLLKMLHDHFVRLNTELAKDATSKDFVLSDQALITLALDMEQAAATENPTIYSNVMKNKVVQYKRLSLVDWKEERKKDIEAKTAKEIKTSNSNGIPKKVSSPTKPIGTGLSEYHELLLLHRLYVDYVKIPQEQHGFVLTPPTDEMIETSLKGLEAARNWECCDRCKTRFQVFPGRRESDGALSTGGPCEFHWGKAFAQDLGTGIRGRGDRKYLCCGQAVGTSAGCIKNEHHVFKVKNAARLATVLQFLETPENPQLEKKLGPKEVLRPVCIDGEMAFTVNGMELIRLTATSWPAGSELLDILVRPLGEILDVNTRFSGVSTQMLADAKPWTETDRGGSGDLRIASSPVEARDLLLRLLTPKTPIVGHGLENDFNAIRLIHPIVIDTSMMWPARGGLPYRLPLKVLMQEHLGRIIQQVHHLEPTGEAVNSSTENGEAAAFNGGIGGHDSKEDANAAGDLVRYALGEEWAKMKRAGWSWRDPSSIGKSLSVTPSPSPSPSTSPSSTPPPKAPLTPFEQHFVPPRVRHPTQPDNHTKSTHGLTVNYLEASHRDPTIQRPIKERKSGLARGESSEERANRERLERRRQHGSHKRKLDEEDGRNDEDRLKPVKRARDGRTIKAYDDLVELNYDGAGDQEFEDDEEEISI